MANAVLARQRGDDYQPRVFWLEACRLFLRRSKVARVAFEWNRIRAFDDVVVTYAVPLPDERGGVISADYFQAKFHVDQAGSLTAESLIDPAAIGATSFSLLERLHAGVKAAGGVPSRFNLVSAWGVHPDDGLAELVSNRNGELRLDRLFDGTTDKSVRGRIRKAWREHLGLKSDDELREVVTPLRIHAPFRSLEALRIELNFRLVAAGLLPVEDAHQGHPYDDLVRKLHANGSNEFDREALRSACANEGLWVGERPDLSDRTPIGIRSFLRFAEHLDDQTDHLLCLLKHFDGRAILEPARWRSAVAPEVNRFLAEKTDRNGRYLLYLDAHSSIALLVGYALDTKSGVDIALVQRGAGRTAIWEPQLAQTTADAVTSVREDAVHSGGDELAVALGVSHSIGSDVLAYARRALPDVGKLLLTAISHQRTGAMVPQLA
jgi:hypothetical protein